MPAPNSSDWSPKTRERVGLGEGPGRQRPPNGGGLLPAQAKSDALCSGTGSQFQLDLAPIANVPPPTRDRDHAYPNDLGHIGHSGGACAHNVRFAIRRHDRSNGGSRLSKHDRGQAGEERPLGVVELVQAVEPAHRRAQQSLAADPIQHSNRSPVERKAEAT